MRPGADTWVLDVEWDNPNLPALVGPFNTLAEAEEWASLNVVGGTSTLRLLTWPYLRAAVTR